MDNKKIKDQKGKIKNPARNNQSIYVYDKKTKKWKVKNTYSSLNYNYLSRNEWNWLD